VKEAVLNIIGAGEKEGPSMLDLRAEYFRTQQPSPHAFKPAHHVVDNVEIRASLIDFALGLPGVDMRRLTNGKIAFSLHDDGTLGPEDAFIDQKTFMRIGGPDGLIELGLPVYLCEEEGLDLSYHSRREGNRVITTLAIPHQFAAERDAQSLIERAWAYACGL
jgi:hypothetical protein